MPAPPLGSDPAIVKATRMSALETLIRDLHRRKGRERRGLALAEGVRLVEEAVAARVRFRGAVVSPQLESTSRGAALLSALRDADVSLVQVTQHELEKLADTDSPQGIVAVVEPPEWTLDALMLEQGSVVLVLDAVQDPGNVGTILRTAFALGAKGVVALPGTADLLNPKVLRGSMGALFRLPCLAADPAEVVEWANRQTATILVADMPDASENSDRSSPALPAMTAPTLLVLGNEGAGPGEAMRAAAAGTVGIPLAPRAESLNVAIAAGILLYALTRRN